MADPVPREPAARSVMGGGMLVWVRFPQACPSSLDPLAERDSLSKPFTSLERKTAGSSQTKESHL